MAKLVGEPEADMGNVEREHRFELRGGESCLDFVNTVAWRLTDRSVEYLGSYGDLLAWGRQTDLLTSDETRILSERATTNPEEARATLSHAIALREAFHRVLSDAIVGGQPDEGSLAMLNRELSRALSRLRVVHAPEDTYVWAWDWDSDSREPEPDRPLWPVVRSAAELMTSPKLDRVKVCAGKGCGWMFLDESRNGSRRWCDSRDCGNRERVRKHLLRTRASGA